MFKEILTPPKKNLFVTLWHQCINELVAKDKVSVRFLPLQLVARLCLTLLGEAAQVRAAWGYLNPTEQQR